MDKLSSGVHLHLAVHQSHGAGERLLVLVSDSQDTGPGTSQAVGVIFPDIANITQERNNLKIKPLKLLSLCHGAVLLGVKLKIFIKNKIRNISEAILPSYT